MSAKPVNREKMMAQRFAVTAFVFMALVWTIWSITGHSVPTIDSISHRQKVFRDGRVVMVSKNLESSPSVTTPPVNDSTVVDSAKSDTASAQVADTSISEVEPVASPEEEMEVLYKYSFQVPLPFGISRWFDPLFAALFAFLFTTVLNSPKVKQYNDLMIVLSLALLIGGLSGLLAWGFLVGLIVSFLIVIGGTLVRVVFWLTIIAFRVFYNWMTVADLRTEEHDRNLREVVGSGR